MAQDWSKFKVDTTPSNDWSKYSVTDNNIPPKTDNSEKQGSEPAPKASGAGQESNMRALDSLPDSEVKSTPKVLSRANLEDNRGTDQTNIITPKEHESLLSKGWKLITDAANSPSGKMLLTGTNDELEKMKRDAGIVDTKGPGLMEIPGISKLADTIRTKGRESGDYWTGFGSSLLADILGAASSGFDPRASGIKNLPMDLFPSEHPDLITPDFISHAEIPSESLIKDEAGRVLGTENKIPERPNGPWDTNVSNDVIKPVDPEERLLNLAKQKQGMGLTPEIKNTNIKSVPRTPRQIMDSLAPNTTNNELNDAIREFRTMENARKAHWTKGYTDDEFEKFSILASFIRNHPDLPQTLKDEWDQAAKIAQSRGPKFKPGDVVRVKDDSDSINTNNEAILNRNKFSVVTPEQKLIDLSKDNSEYPQDISVKLDAPQFGDTNKPVGFRQEGQANPLKPRLFLNGDGTFTNKDTGEIFDMRGHKVDPSMHKPASLIDASDQMNNAEITHDGGSNIPPEPPDESLPEKDRKFTLSDVINTPKALKASFDLSAPGRQGLGLIHTKAWWSAWNDMFKGMQSNAAFKATQEAINNRPLFKSFGDEPSFAQKAGLKLTNLGKLSDREESFMSGIAEKFPGVKTSERAYTAYLNKLRADTFENLLSKYKVLGENGEYNMDLAKKLADYVNNATGRGGLGNLESSAVALNNAFFSPRFFASRLRVLGEGMSAPFHPSTYIFSQPNVRREYLKSLLAIAGVGVTIGELAKMAGGNLEPDPRNSDFAKIRVGNTRIDPYAGMQQPVVLASRLLSGKSISSTSGKETDLSNPRYGQSDRMDVIGRFARSKESPALAFAHGLLTGKDAGGNKFNVPEEIVQLFVPMVLQDLKQVATENPNLIPYMHEEGLGLENFDAGRSTLALPGFFGASVQNYGRPTR